MDITTKNLIAACRKQEKITQVDLSFRSGIERKRLGAIERQERECLLSEALAISDALGCSVNDLFVRNVELCGWTTGGTGSSALNLSDVEFGNLKVKHRIVGTHRHKGEAFWFCECDCGGTAIVRSDNLRSGHTKSCGCLVSENFILNGRNSVRL